MSSAIILEDDSANARVIVSILEGIGISCKVASTTGEFMPLLIRSVAESTSQIGRPEPLFALLDVFVTGGGGISVFEQIQDQFPFVPVVFCSGQADVSLAVAQVKNGALDFLQKPFRSTELIEAAETALDRFSILYHRHLDIDKAAAIWDELTPRERELVPLLLSAESTRQIAGTLGISPRTVEAHRASLMNKIDGESIIDLDGFWGLLASVPNLERESVSCA